jgi:high-affinity nickel permease
MGTTIGVLVLLVAVSNLIILIQLSNRLTRLARDTVKPTRKPRAKKVTPPAPPTSVL